MAQPSSTFQYQSFDKKHGLRTTKIYAVAQNKQGFVWIGGDLGISWFDGVNFHPLGKKDGFYSTTIHEIITLNDSTLLAVGKNPMYFYWLVRNKIVRSVSFEISPTSLFNPGFNTEKQLITINSSIEILLYNLKTDKKLVFQDIDSDLFENTYPYNDSTLLCNFGYVKGAYLFHHRDCRKELIQGTEHLKIIKIYKKEGQLFELIATSGRYLLSFEPETLLTKIAPSLANPQNLNKTAYYQGNLWHTFIGKGLFYLNPQDEIVNIGEYLHLENTQVNDLFVDPNENLWIATHGKGLFVLAKSWVTNYSIRDGLLSDYILDMDISPQGTVVYATNNGAGMITRDGQFINEKGPVLYSMERRRLLTGRRYYNNFVSDVSYLNGHWFQSLDRKYRIGYRSFGQDTLTTIRYSAIEHIRDSVYLYGYWNRLQVMIWTGKKHYYEDPKIVRAAGKMRVNHILKNDNHSAWIGTMDGIYYFDIDHRDSELEPINERFAGVPPAGSAMICEEIIWGIDSSLLAATSKGAFRLKDSSCTQLGSFEQCNTIVQVGDGSIWAGTSDGLYHIQDDQVIKHHTGSGLINDEINKIIYDSIRNVLWVGTVSGISKLDLDLYASLKQSTYPVLIHTMDVIGDTVINESDQIDLSHTQNGIRFQYSLLAFNNPRHREYKYRLVGIHDNWQITDRPIVEFMALAPGTYAFEVQGRIEGGGWSESAQVTFSIHPPFWRTTIFIVTALFLVQLIFVSLIFNYYRNRIKRLRRAQNQRERIRLLEQRARNASLNPHFVFNALNSIQSFTGRSDKKGTIEFIGDFARLIRTNMDVADHSHITLEEELKRLQLFINIERRRLDHRFDYKLEIDPSLEAEQGDILIPNMILQPIVENSIWHGLAPLETQGLLEISLQGKSSNMLQITITDNGKGLKSSVRRPGHQSKGLELTQERLTYFSALNEFTISELKNEQGEVIGTQAEFLIQVD